MKYLIYSTSFLQLLFLISQFSVRSGIGEPLRKSAVGSYHSRGQYFSDGEESALASNVTPIINNEKCIQTKLYYSVVPFHYKWRVENLLDYMMYCRKFNQDFQLSSPDLVFDTAAIMGNWKFSLFYDSRNRLRFQAIFSIIRDRDNQNSPRFGLLCKVVTEENETSLPELHSRGRSFEWPDIVDVIAKSAKNETIEFQLTVNYYYSPDLPNLANENHYNCKNDLSVGGNSPSADLLNYTPPFTNYLSNLMQDEKYIDVLIKTKNDTNGIQAHRVILANSSPILASLVYNSTFDKNESIIDMEDIDYDVVRQLIMYLYTGKIDDIEQMADRLILIAHRFELNNLKDICETFLIKNVKLDNALKLYSLGMNTFSSKLSKRAFAVMKENKTKLAARSEEFRTLSVEYPNLMFELFVS